jgi:maltose alpha-D-glucosyltransferase/alpha-amylase
MLTLAGHGFYWFELTRPAEERPAEEHEHRATSVADSLLAAGIVGDAQAPSAHPEHDPSAPGGAR